MKCTGIFFLRGGGRGDAEKIHRLSFNIPTFSFAVLVERGDISTRADY